MARQYLGDQVYAEFDGYHWMLYTNDGIRDTNTIALDPYVFEAVKALRVPPEPVTPEDEPPEAVGEGAARLSA